MGNDNISKVMGLMGCIRLVLAIVDLNFDYADQYWQGPQIAYKIATGKGYETWEWTMDEPIRNPVYQYYLSIGYRMAIGLNLSVSIIQISPRLMQLFIGLISDYFFLKTIAIYYKQVSIKICLFLLTNWFYLSMMSRTYINSWQTAFTLAAFYFWKCSRQGASSHPDLLSRVLVTIAYISRPTSIIVWAVIWPYQLLISHPSFSLKIRFIFKNILHIIIMLSLSFIVGSVYFDRVTSTDYNFFKYNILMKWSQLFGVHPYAYYFTVSIPLILGGYLGGLINGIYNTVADLIKNNNIIKENKQPKPIALNNKLQLLILTFLTLIILSFSTHKEHRFILLLIPFLLILCINGFITLRPSFQYALFTISIVVNVVLFITVAMYGKTQSFTMLHQVRGSGMGMSTSTTPPPVIVYLADPHALPAYSKVITPAQILIADSSPIRKLSHSDQTQLLFSNPEQLFNKLRNNLELQVDFIVCQWKYLYTKGELKKQYNFILQKGYQLVGSYRNCLIWEEYFGDGLDGFVLFKKIQN